MAFTYIIDGYNLIWSTERFDGPTLRDQRENLLRYLETMPLIGGASKRVIVVFDGRENVESPPWKGKVTVLFSSGKDADTLIKNKVDGMKNPSESVIVTDDKSIQRWVRMVKASVVGCNAFLSGATKRTRSKQVLSGKPDPADFKSFNEHLKKIWK